MKYYLNKIISLIFVLAANILLIACNEVSHEDSVIFSTPLTYFLDDPEINVSSVRFNIDTNEYLILNGTDTTPTFRIMMLWLEENQDYFFEIPLTEYSEDEIKDIGEHDAQVILITNGEPVHFAINLELLFYNIETTAENFGEIKHLLREFDLLENFWEFYYGIVTQVSAADFDWTALHLLHTYIILEGVGINPRFRQSEHDLNVIMDFLSVNTNSLQIAWNTEERDLANIRINLGHPMFPFEETFIFTNGVAYLLLDDEAHERLWDLLEIEFRMMRDGSDFDWTLLSITSNIMNLLIHDYERIDRITLGGDWWGDGVLGWTSFDMNSRGDGEILLEWLREHHELLGDEPFEGSVHSHIDFARQRLNFHHSPNLLDNFTQYLWNTQHEVFVYSIRQEDWRYLSDNYRNYLYRIMIAGPEFDRVIILENHRDNLSPVLDFLADNIHLLHCRMTVGGFEWPEGMSQLRIYFLMSNLSLTNRFINGDAMFFVDASLHNELWSLMNR